MQKEIYSHIAGGPDGVSTVGKDVAIVVTLGPDRQEM